MPQIAFNGKTYNSLEEMPPAQREAYSHIMSIFADANQNGVPDIFEGELMKNMMSFASAAMVVHGNQSYTLENMPPDVRAKYEEAMKKLQTLGLIPQGLSLGQSVPPITTAAYSSTPQPALSTSAQPAQSVIEDASRPNVVAIVVSILVALMVCGALAVVLMRLTNR